MNAEQFTLWLQGFVELQDSPSITEKQWLVIKDHLKLVFDKKTPDRGKQPLSQTYDDILKCIKDTQQPLKITPRIEYPSYDIYKDNPFKTTTTIC